ncbi:MAG: sensor histidine kinase [Omnitrophica WOR_2 bacterium]
MRHSILFKLMGAFLLVIAIGALVILWMSNRATQNAFNLYTTRSGQAWAQQLAPTYADYYARNGGWQGVENLLQAGVTDAGSTGMMNGSHGNGMGPGYGQGRGLGTGAGMMSGMGQRLILADAQGKVIGDTQAELIGRVLPAAQLANGATLIVNGETVGTLIVTPSHLVGAADPASEFLSSVSRSVLAAVSIAGGFALLLAAVLLLQITAPLRQLKKAAQSIAQGDLSQRIAVRTHDEFGELGVAFNQMAESLSKAEDQRRQMIADVAHELRTPLTVIQANLEGMQDGVIPVDGDQLNSLHAETTLLGRLIADLRLLSLAEAGELVLERQETDLGELVRRLVERNASTAQQKGISLEAEIQPGLPQVFVDADRIAQVLNNLVGNALRYTPAGGKITLQAAINPSNPKEVQLSVTDTGPGIAAGDLPYIFDRFYRADKSRSRSSGGSGLGLAIVKQLVEAHGGKITAESPVYKDKDSRGYGTRFSFTLMNHR